MAELMTGDLSVKHPYRPNMKAKPGEVDELVNLYETMKQERDQLDFAIMQIRQTLQAMSVGDKKTRRIQGANRRIKLTMADDSWDQEALKTAWHDFPQYAENALRIERLAPRLRELNKWESMSGDRQFEVCKKMVLGARRPSTRPATITIEQ